MYEHATFNTSKSLLTSGTFESYSDINGWSGSFVNLSRDTSTKMDGNASLRVSKMTEYKQDIPMAKAKGPLVSTVKNNQYTLVFSARSSQIREITATVGNKSNRFIIGPSWRRVVFTFKANSTGNQRVSFGVGRENYQTWFDSVYFFKGNANVFRRNFDNGIVVANATPSNRVVDLGGTFQRIKGNQDPINNGATLTSVTIDPWDAAILVRPDKGDINPPPDDVDPCGEPSYDKTTERALLVWKSCNGSDRWHVRGVFGNTVESINYYGNIVNSDGTFSNLNPINLESTDIVQLTSTKNKINVDLTLYNVFQDGFDFTMPAGQTACFNLNPKSLVRVGRNKIQLPDSGCLK